MGCRCLVVGTLNVGHSVASAGGQPNTDNSWLLD